MPYEIIEHIADLRVRATGRSLEELFRDAARGMMDFMNGLKDKSRKSGTRLIKAASADKTALLVDYLNEILSSAQINKEAYDKIIFKKLTENEIEAELRGNPVLLFAKDIKAATYHEAEIKQNDAGLWETILVFDI